MNRFVVMATRAATVLTVSGAVAQQPGKYVVAGSTSAGYPVSDSVYVDSGGVLYNSADIAADNTQLDTLAEHFDYCTDILLYNYGKTASHIPSSKPIPIA